MTQLAPSSETDLVARSLTGDTSAFADIVRRYQSLICAIAYNATGDLARSEDLSQEIFVSAWRNLASLDNPAKLRPWLCGIARNLINNSFRTRARHPAQSLDTASAQETPSPEPQPLAQAITNEQQALLWQSLERIPEIYREPLILFYRQQHSLQHVADALDLSEDTVKQRLSRGRKLLHDHLLSFVEETLTRSNPSSSFASNVLIALPSISAGAKAAALGATAAKGSATAKSAALLGLLSALATPLMMVVGYYASYRLGMDTSKSDAERSLIKGFYKRLMACLIAFAIAFVALCAYGRGLLNASPTAFAAAVITLGAAYLLASIALSFWVFARRRALRKLRPVADKSALPMQQYISPRTFLGIPLLSMSRGGGFSAAPGPLAWVSIGDCPRALLFAYGGNAIAPIAVGGSAIGLLSFGGMAIGLVSFGGFSIGLFAIGGLTLGLQAFGGLSLAWHAASGGIAVAHNYALGGLVVAANANNAVAQSVINHLLFFRIAGFLADHALLMNLCWFLPLLLWLRTIRKEKRTLPANQ